MAVGTWMLSAVTNCPRPHCPAAFHPHAATLPSDSTPRQWPSPAATCSMRVARRSAGRGVRHIHTLRNSLAASHRGTISCASRHTSQAPSSLAYLAKLDAPLPPAALQLGVDDPS